MSFKKIIFIFLSILLSGFVYTYEKINCNSNPELVKAGCSNTCRKDTLYVNREVKWYWDWLFNKTWKEYIYSSKSKLTISQLNWAGVSYDLEQNWKILTSYLASDKWLNGNKEIVAFIVNTLKLTKKPVTKS